METNAVQVRRDEIVSSIVLKGDISGLNSQQKVEYYKSVCERVGIDPSTQPFQLLNLQGKQVLYCSKAGAEQLTKKHKISHDIRDRQTVSDVFVVYVRAIDAEGRFEDSSGAVNIAGLKGDALANAMMKAETKAKRRSTLSLLGLGMLDETEIETIPNAAPIAIPQEVETPRNEPTATPQSEPTKGGFNPAIEEANSKKYPEKKWAELPNDYLQWMMKNAKSPDLRKKAEATIKWLEMQNASKPQEPDVTEEMFGKRSNEEVFDVLSSTLDEASRTQDVGTLQLWVKSNEIKIAQLPSDKKTILRNAYSSAVSLAKKAAESAVAI